MALMKRRNVRFKHESYLAGLVASTVANVSGKVSQHRWSPFDFVPDTKRYEAREQLKHNIMTMLSFISDDAVSKKIPEAELIQRTVERLKAQGHEDAEEIIQELFPHWEKRE